MAIQRPMDPDPAPPLAIFDLDGTLIDSGANILAGLRATFAELGLPVPGDTELVHYIGPPVWQSFLARAGLDRAGADAAALIYGRISNEHFRDGVTVYPGIRECLHSLAEQGVQLAIATSKPEHQALALLDELDLRALFTVVVGYLPTGARDSKAMIIRDVLDRVTAASAAPRSVVMVGDREHDITGADANGVISVWAGWGYGSPAEGALAMSRVTRPDLLTTTIVDLLAPQKTEGVTVD